VLLATAPSGQIAHVELIVAKAIEALRLEGYELNGASCCSVYAYEYATRDGLEDLADARMHENKRRSGGKPPHRTSFFSFLIAAQIPAVRPLELYACPPLWYGFVLVLDGCAFFLGLGPRFVGAHE
jgi:hypothetical protein